MRKGVLACVLVLLSSLSAAAQTTGSMNGTVTDNTGAALPGVTVTATSPAIMGAQVVVTNPQGQYRFPSLPVGTYSVKFELASFATVTRQGIPIGVGFNATIDQQLSIASLQEQITVTGVSPVVDTNNTNIQTNITKEQLDNIPNARDIWSVIGQSPGMMVTSFDVGGSRAGTQTGYSAFGFSGQVRVQVDGVNTTEGTGGAGFYYDYGSFEELQLGSDGNDASAATPGVQLNAVIKSGGNRFKGDLYFDYENKDFQGKNVTDELRRLGVGSGQRILAYRDPNISLGGPIKRDKLWFFGSFRDQRTGVTVDGFPANNPNPNFEFETRLTNITYKINYQFNQDNRFGHYIQWGRKFQPHRGASSTAYADAPFRQDSWSWAANFDWNSVMGDRFFFNTRYATFGYDWPNYGYGASGEVGTNLTVRRTENLTGNTAGSSNQDQNDRKRHQFDWTGTLFRDNLFKGDHALKFGWLSEWETQEFTDFGFVDDLNLTFSSVSGEPDFTRPLRVTIRNTDRFNVNSSWHHGAFLSDQWKVTRAVTLTLGVRWDYYSSYFPDQPILPGPWRDFIYGGLPLPNGYSVPATPFAGTYIIPGVSDIRTHASVAPRIGVAWKLRPATVVKLNWGRFYHNTGTASGGINPAQSITYTFNWNDVNGDKRFTNNEFGSFVSSAGGATLLVDPNIKHTYTDSSSAWLEHEVVNNVGIRAGYTFRSDKDNAANVELQRLGSLYTSTVTVRDPGPDGTLGNGDDGPNFTVFDIPTGVTIPTSRTETRTVEDIIGIDRSFDITLTKRMSNRWSGLVNFLYNWDRDRGFVQQPNQARFNDSTVTTWAFRVNGTYMGPWGLVISPSLRHQAGDPLSRIIQATSGVDERGVTRSIRIGTVNYQGEEPGAYREDHVTIFDTRVEKRFRLGNANLGVFFDAFNLNNTNASQSADSVVGRRTTTLPSGEVVNYQRFLRPTGTLPPRIYRLGLRYSF